MQRQRPVFQTRLSNISAAILLIGLGCATAIYLLANDDEDISSTGYDVVNGQVYSRMKEKSKKQIHDLELYGGKAAVLADDIDRWFYGLWHGTSLAYTVAGIGIILAGGVFLAAHYEHVSSSSDDHDKDTP